MKKQVAIYAIIAVFLTSMVVPSFAGRVSAASVSSRTPAHTQILDKSRFVLHVGLPTTPSATSCTIGSGTRSCSQMARRRTRTNSPPGYPHRTTNLVKACSGYIPHPRDRLWYLQLRETIDRW